MGARLRIMRWLCRLSRELLNQFAACPRGQLLNGSNLAMLKQLRHSPPSTLYECQQIVPLLGGGEAVAVAAGHGLLRHRLHLLLHWCWLRWHWCLLLHLRLCGWQLSGTIRLERRGLDWSLHWLYG